MKPGDTVTVTGYPERYIWMDDFVSKRGRIAQVDERDEYTVYGVKGLLPDGELAWLGGSYLEPVEQVA